MDKKAWWATVHGLSATTEATGHTCTQSMFIMEKKKFSYMRPLALCKIPQGKIVNASA